MDTGICSRNAGEEEMRRKVELLMVVVCRDKVNVIKLLLRESSYIPKYELTDKVLHVTFKTLGYVALHVAIFNFKV